MGTFRSFVALGVAIGAVVLVVSCGNDDSGHPRPSALWARTYQDDAISLETFDISIYIEHTRVATDGSVVAVVGDILGIADGPLPNNGNGSGLVALLDAKTGAPQFEQVISAQNSGTVTPRVHALSTAVVADGVIVAGGFDGMLTLGTEVGLAGFDGAFIAKLDRTGQVAWAKFPGGGFISQVRADDAGNVFVVGSFPGQLDFGAGKFPDVTELGSKLFIAKLDRSGTQVFAHAYTVTLTGTGVTSGAQSLALDASGNATWLGSFSGTIDLGDGPRTSPMELNVFSSEWFLARTSATGDFVWARSLGGTIASDVAVEASGTPVLVGDCRNGVDLGWGVVPCADRDNGFIAKLGDSAPVYFRELAVAPAIQVGSTSSTGSVELLGVTVGANGDAVVAGAFIGDLTIGSATVKWTSALNANHYFTWDALLAAFDSTGRAFWTQGFGDMDHQVGQAVAADDAGHLFATGWLGGTVKFSPSITVTTQYPSDVFVAAFSL